MKKVVIISLALVTSFAFVSCGASNAAGNGYHGVSNAKMKKQQQKEFQKPKHKIKKSKKIKRGN
ncbi:MAG: hypothetical protein DCO96_04150 [Fluviicola sp. XM-24bin1]|nr:MAG: hypothetical protein DCO96_04150 [Fluviicola sp. XM-24bin1]